MGNNFIDVFFNEKDQFAPYQANIWHDGRVVERVSHQRLCETVAFCKKRKLPVVANDSELIFWLHSYGLDAELPQARALGGIE